MLSKLTLYCLTRWVIILTFIQNKRSQVLFHFIDYLLLTEPVPVMMYYIDVCSHDFTEWTKSRFTSDNH